MNVGKMLSDVVLEARRRFLLVDGRRSKLVTRCVVKQLRYEHQTAAATQDARLTRWWVRRGEGGREELGLIAMVHLLWGTQIANAPLPSRLHAARCFANKPSVRMQFFLWQILLPPFKQGKTGKQKEPLERS
jgi:hypothetical protein